MTFQSERFGSWMAWTSIVSTGPVPGTYWSSSCVPTAYVVKRTGIVSLPASDPLRSPVRPGLPSLKITTAEAPAASAFAAFVAKVQVPRWTRAMLPAVKPAKSAAEQPLAELGAGVAGTTIPPAGCTCDVVWPADCPGLNSVPSPNECGSGDSSRITGSPMKLK